METASNQDGIVRWLSRPSAYAHGPEHVEHRQTHISHVFLAGPLVYKLKKPVKFDFLDFSTLAAREHACREEVRLNRRLAADAYLRAAPINQAPDSSLQIDGPGEVVDWLVEMRRLPTEMTLDALARRGMLRPEPIGRLSETLVRFYRALKPLALTAEQYRERCRSHIQGNRRELLAEGRRLPRSAAMRVHGFQLQLVALKPELLDERVASGRIVEGHGDLRPEHICLSEPIVIFDCIEFNAEYRQLDIADELSFLAAECDELGVAWVGPQLLEAYQRESGDRPPAELIAFYKSYRAAVRAKVAALRADQLSGPAHEEAVGEAQRRLEFADQYVMPWLRPLVLVVGGLSGTGKSTLASALAEALGAELLRTDVLRQEMFAGGARRARADEGVYSHENRERVYEAMLQVAATLLAERISVVLDGTFAAAEVVMKAASVSAAAPALFLAIECVCSPEVAQERITRRLAEGRDASEARPEIHDLQRQRWQPWPPGIRQVRVDTEQPLAIQVASVLAALARGGGSGRAGPPVEFEER